MSYVEFIATLMFWVQVTHSIEELATGFHKKWFFFKMSFEKFLTFEILHTLFWSLVLFFTTFPARDVLLSVFIVLMFAQGSWHLAWWATEKHYVPGLFTAFIHILLFLAFYFRILS